MDYTMIGIAILLLIIGVCLLVSRPWKSHEHQCECDCHEEKSEEVISQPFKTHYLYVALDGTSYPVYVSPTGSFYITRVSASGKEYNYYLRNKLKEEYTEKFKQDYPHQTIFRD